MNMFFYIHSSDQTGHLWPCWITEYSSDNQWHQGDLKPHMPSDLIFLLLLLLLLAGQISQCQWLQPLPKSGQVKRPHPPPSQSQKQVELFSLWVIFFVEEFVIPVIKVREAESSFGDIWGYTPVVGIWNGSPVNEWRVRYWNHSKCVPSISPGYLMTKAVLVLCGNVPKHA